MTLAEVYAALLRRGVRCFSGDYALDAGADAVVIKLDGSWGLFLDDRRIRSAAAEKTAASHELAHIMEDATYGIEAPAALREMAEHKAERWQYEHVLPWPVLVQYLRSGMEPWEIAEAECVTERFVRDALAYYINKRGMSA